MEFAALVKSSVSPNHLTRKAEKPLTASYVNDPKSGRTPVPPKSMVNVTAGWVLTAADLYDTFRPVTILSGLLKASPASLVTLSGRLMVKVQSAAATSPELAEQAGLWATTMLIVEFREIVLVADFPEESATAAVKEKDPSVRGTPVMAPLTGLSVSPEGREPLIIEKE
jgi:hypothetical protein